MGEITLQLNSPLTDEQWDTITDVDFDHTDRITFHTKHGKEVEFVKSKPIKTNADKIRQMSDEDLSYILVCPHKVCNNAKMECGACIRAWLKQEVRDGDA